MLSLKLRSLRYISHSHNRGFVKSHEIPKIGPTVVAKHPLRVGWRNFFPLSLKGSSSPYTLCMCIARIRLVIHVNNK
jgi:hypothetical protein